MATPQAVVNVIPPKYRNSVIHDRGPAAYPGAYQVTDAALSAYGITRELFGSTEVVNADGSTFRVKDYQYVLDDGSVGMTFLPVNDNGAAAGPDGNMVYGSVLVDEFLRQHMGLSADDPVYALIYFIHPELNKGSASDLAKTDKFELGITHMGAYLGNGRTSNSPALYHNRGWAVKGETYNKFGYPANVLVLRLSGVDQATLNKNLHLADNVLNYGVRFPLDYKNSQFRPVNINAALMFYRDWILERHYVRTDVSWFTYCAAHKTVVADIGLNLPHNLAAFKEVYGDKEGADFFDAFSRFHFALFGEEFTADRQTTFEPLWKKQGLTPAQIRPFATVDDYAAWDNARMTGTLDRFTGFTPLAPDQGTPWAPQMTADAIYDFLQTYADFVDAGAITMSAALFGYADLVVARTRISKLEFLSGAVPIVQRAMEAHARAYAAAQPSPSYTDSAYYAATSAALYKALGGSNDADDATAAPEHELQDEGSVWNSITALAAGELAPNVLVWISLARVRDNWGSIIASGQVPMATAYVDFMDAIQGDIEKARDMVVRDARGIEFNTPPAIGHMIGIGMFPCNALVSVKPVVTVMNYTELERKPA